jgi:photosystem II stability/assembly factor-like uncharacterized protein
MRITGFGLSLFALMSTALPAQSDSTLSALKWRSIGPFIPGRSDAVAGSVARPKEYYAGTTGSGVFKTTDGGISWLPVTDRYFGGTIGAIAIAPTNPDIVYVGGGESHLRNNLSHGYGVWKTTDGGKSWKSIGLNDTRHIARILVDPGNPDVVYVGAFGHAFGPNPERGVFRSTDGGATWKKILFRNDSTGVSEMAMDPKDPKTIYVGFYQAERKAWTMVSGGMSSGIFKTTDGGDTWTELSKNSGLPPYPWGRIGITVSPVNPRRVWTIIEAKEGGIFRSDDAGATWKLANNSDDVRDRPFYYSRIFADPKDENTLIELTTQFLKSTDTAKTFKVVNTPHPDHHDLWVDPTNPQRMIVAEDGGAAITETGGASWIAQRTATGQFYRVTTSNHFPYRVCGSQQDNGAWCAPSRKERGTWLADWYSPGNSESGYVAVDPKDPDITYTANGLGVLSRVDARTGFSRDVSPIFNGMGLLGRPSGGVLHRFNWTTPVVIPENDPSSLYVAAQVLFRSRDGGQSWGIVSPDLTANSPRTTGGSGGPISPENVSQEWYATIHTVSPSPVTKGVIWTGSDDGLVYVTRDNGANWKNVTPPGLLPDTKISLIDASPHSAGTAYAAVNRYMVDDFTPHIYKTSDYGETWTKITNGIASDEAVRVVREDPARRGLLYAGTERTVWYSLDDGANWNSLQLNLPSMPITDLVVKEADLVISTFGRGFLVLDDITPLRQLTSSIVSGARAHLFQPRDVHRINWGQPFRMDDYPSAHNPPSGVLVDYWLPKARETVTIELRDEQGALITTFDSKRDSLQVSARQGVNRFAWELRYPDVSMRDSSGRPAPNGPTALPGKYTVKLVAGGESQARPVRIVADPRFKTDLSALRAQFDLDQRALGILGQMKTVGDNAADLMKQLTERRKTMESKGNVSALDEAANKFKSILQAVDDSVGDHPMSRLHPYGYPLNPRARLNMGARMGMGDAARPNEPTVKGISEMEAEAKRNASELDRAIRDELPKVNAVLEKNGVPKIELRRNRVATH